MKKLIFSLITAAICSLSSSAIIIDLTPLAAPAQPASSGDAIILAWVQSGVTNYNTANNPDLPTPVVSDFRNNQNDNNGFAGSTVFGANVTNLNIALMGHQYVALHWGGPASGAQVNYQVLYVGGEASYTANNADQQGLSFYELFNKTDVSVPDNGSTLILLGLGLGLIGFLKRRKSA